MHAAGVRRAASVGGQFIVSPDTSLKVIQATKAKNIISYPGAMTATDCFIALRNGAYGIKFFPASVLGTYGLKAILTFLPINTKTYAVGGVGTENFREWLCAEITGFGIGSALYQLGFNSLEVSRKVEEIADRYG